MSQKILLCGAFDIWRHLVFRNLPTWRPMLRKRGPWLLGFCCRCLHNWRVTMGRRRKKIQFKGDRRDKGHYSDIVKENQRYEDYYRAQKCIPEGEFDDFLAAMRVPLPAVFRITGYKKHAKQLLKQMKEKHFPNIVDVKLDEKDDVIKMPVALPWYPDDLAWQTNLSRTQIRKVPELEKFHNFLITETESGHVTRQESVSMIPPLLLDVKPHHKILDLCAAPGSKTAQLIEMLHSDDDNKISEGLCIANDKDNNRCYMLVHQMNRLNSTNAIVVNHDGATFPELCVKDDSGGASYLRFDRVLADVPCSGDGTMRKNSDVWQKWNVGNALYLHGMQVRILQRGLELLATGGRIVYSTCSLNPIEDEAVVGNMLEKCDGAVELVDVISELKGLKWCPGVSTWKIQARDGSWYESYSEVPEAKRNIRPSMFPPQKASEMHLERCMRLLPHHQDTGGFFVAVLKKVKNLPWENTVRKQAKAAEITQACEEKPDAPPAKKKKWGPGYREDPFVFFSDNDTEVVSSIKSYYSLNDDFPAGQLLTRTHTGKKRHIYMVSSLVKNVVTNNEDKLKLINCGVRVFSRSDNNQPNLKCAFRIVQDGNECIVPYMQKRVVKTKLADVIVLLCEEQPPYETLSEELREQLSDLEPGSMTFKFEPESENDAVACDLTMSGWRGRNSARLYMNKFERAHFLNLIGHEIPDEFLPNKNNRRKRAENSDEATADSDAGKVDQNKDGNKESTDTKENEAAGDARP